MEERKVPKWLEDIQENSWELELLISGGAIFSLFQASDFYNESMLSLRIITNMPGLDMLTLLGAFGIKILTLGFILHLLLRAFWLALVCINYVFPQGVRQENVRWKKPFRPGVHQGQDLYDVILKTDNLCGLVMYMSIISTFMLGGIVMILLLLLSVPEAIFNLSNNPGFDFYVDLVLFGLLAYILDLLFFGLFRKIPGLSYLLFPLFWIFDVISLRFLLQRSLWIFSTNIRKPRFAMFAMLFMVVAIFYSYLSIYQHMRWINIFDSRKYLGALADNPWSGSGLYEDRAEGKKVRFARIESKKISGEYLELFVLYQKKYDNYIENHKEITHFSDLLSVYIDDSLYHPLSWFPAQKGEDNQVGVSTMVPVAHLPSGAHLLKVINASDTMEIRMLNEDLTEKIPIKHFVVPFWKESQ